MDGPLVSSNEVARKSKSISSLLTVSMLPMAVLKRGCPETQVLLELPEWLTPNPSELSR